MLDEKAILNLAEGDKRKFIAFGSGESVVLPYETLQEAFEKNARYFPDVVAAEHTSRRITYSELNRQANKLAHALKGYGIGPNYAVGLFAKRSIEFLVGIMGILKAGGYYVPQDVGVSPISQLAEVINQTKCNVVLTLNKFESKVNQAFEVSESKEMTVFSLDETKRYSLLHHNPDDAHLKNPDNITSPMDTAYTIFTSGTTGTPKGVQVCHKNLVNVLLTFTNKLGMCPGSRVSQLLSVSFDMGSWEMLGSMVNGSTLVIRTSTDWKDAVKSVNTVIATPSILQKFEPEDIPHITHVAVAGEPCPLETAQKWARFAEFYNCCGPTEITIVNTGSPYRFGQPLSIGRPTPNNNVYILSPDSRRLPVPIGEVGEMWAGGLGITLGYLNRPDLTSVKYLIDPFVNNGSYMFKTGDLARWLPNGEIEMCGRVDDQVKIKGFRVELDGVSAAMEKTDHVSRAVAIKIGDELIGFVAPKVDSEKVKAKVGGSLPYYMVPSKVVGLAELPKTKNGKIDKRVLKASFQSGEFDTIPMSEVSKSEHDQSAIRRESQRKVSNNHIVPESLIASTQTDYKMPFPRDQVIQVHTIEKGFQKGNLSEAMDLSGFTLPEHKSQVSWWRNFRYKFLTRYRQLNILVLLTNTMFLALGLGGVRPEFATLKGLSMGIIINVFISTMIRQQYIVNAIFWVVIQCPTSAPLWLRVFLGHVYHFGGLHSGCAIGATTWLVVFTIKLNAAFSSKYEGISLETLTVTYMLLVTILIILVMAYPSLRNKFHNHFEATHRLMGWTSLILVWIFLVLFTRDLSIAEATKTGSEPQPLGLALLNNPALYLVSIMCISIIIPWLKLRWVTVNTEVLSERTAVLHFKYTTPFSGCSVALSTSPLFEWHSFASIKRPGEEGFRLMIANAGDWTGRLIASPPRKIYVRGIPTAGILRIEKLFKKVVYVATGSGIGPCISHILRGAVNGRLFWSCPKPVETFGKEFVNEIIEHAPDAYIHDTKTMGKPDMLKIAIKIYQDIGAEAIFIISNPKLTYQVVQGCEARGIPCYGAIWDS